MANFFKRLFSKSDEYTETQLPKEQQAIFKLKFDNIVIATLRCENGLWEFKYTEDFKKQADEYYTIAGFSDINKVYTSSTLWPFFQTRIPGLKQPAVREILLKENINQQNEYELLKRFGKKTINNPYELDPA
jgi:hypothetical protein